jgi:hypothetical protein
MFFKNGFEGQFIIGGEKNNNPLVVLNRVKILFLHPELRV